MKNIFKFLPFIACTTFLVASCGKNNPQKNEVNVSLQSTMLKIDKVTTEKNRDYLGHIFLKEEYAIPAYALPIKIDSITVSDEKLSLSDYEYVIENNTGILTINARKVTGDIKITAEAISLNQTAKLQSSSLIFGNDGYTTNITKDYPVQIKHDSDFLSEHYELPFTLPSVSMNGNELVADTDYKYMYSLGLFTMLIDCTGPITIKAELSVSHAVKITSSVKVGAVIKSSESVNRVESSDTISHLTKVVIANDYLSTYKITGTKEDVNITLDGNKIPCTKYEIFNDLKGAEISYMLPLIPFTSDDKDLIIDVPVEPLNDPHDIVMKSGELSGHLEFKAPTNPYISKEFGVDIEVEYKDGDKIKNIVVPNNEQGYANFEATLSDSKNVTYKSSSCKNNNGNLVFSFEKLPADKQFASGPLTFSTNLADNNFAEPVNVNVIVDESTCNKIEMIIAGQTTSSKTSSFSLMAKEGTIKSDITAAEVIEVLKAAHDSANRKIYAHEINNVTIDMFLGITMINFSLNLRQEYSAVDDVPTLCLYNLNNLISQ